MDNTILKTFANSNIALFTPKGTWGCATSPTMSAITPDGATVWRIELNKDTVIALSYKLDVILDGSSDWNIRCPYNEDFIVNVAENMETGRIDLGFTIWAGGPNVTCADLQTPTGITREDAKTLTTILKTIAKTHQSEGENNE